MNEKLRHLLDSFAYELTAFVGSSLLMFFYGLRRRLQGGQQISQSLEVQTVTKEERMDKVIPISSEAKVDVKLANGKLYLIGGYDGVDLDAKLELGVEVDILLDKLAEKVPGKIDDAIIEVLKAALKVV